MTRSAPALYDDDFFAWTQTQAAALRQLPAVPGHDVDIAHVAEEIEDLGKRDLRDVTSILERLFEHLIKLAADPNGRDVPHWRGETTHFQMSAVAAFSPSMRQLIDLPRVWSRGRKRASIARTVPPEVASAPCPFVLDELLDDNFDLDAAVARLAASAPT